MASNRSAPNCKAVRGVEGALRRALSSIIKKLLRWDQKRFQKSVALYRFLNLVAALISWFPIPIRHLLFWFGSDKHRPMYHSYGWTYQELFRSLKYRRVKLLEIGLGGTDDDIGGRSLLAWRAFFPRGTIVGFDYKFKAVLAARHTRIHQGNQGSLSDLTQLITLEGPFDIIIDDGSHLSEHQLISFRALFSALNENGIYVIEDVQTSYWPAEIGGVHWDGADPDDVKFSETCMGFFLGLAKYLSHAEFLRAPLPDSPFVPFMAEITKITFEHNLIVVVKGDNREPSVLSLTNSTPRIRPPESPGGSTSGGI